MIGPTKSSSRPVGSSTSYMDLKKDERKLLTILDKNVKALIESYWQQNFIPKVDANGEKSPLFNSMYSDGDNSKGSGPKMHDAM